MDRILKPSVSMAGTISQRRESCQFFPLDEKSTGQDCLTAVIWGKLSAEFKMEYEGEFCGYILTVFLGRLETRLFDRPERFLIEPAAASLDDFRFADGTVRIDDDFQSDVALHPHAQRRRWVSRTRHLDR